MNRVVCGGGDGTLNETVHGLLLGGHRTPLGYIPAEARTTLPPASAFRGSFSGRWTPPARREKPFLCDMGCFNGRTFVYIAAFGAFYRRVLRDLAGREESAGPLAYVLEGMSRLPNLGSYRVRVEHGSEVIEDEFLFGMVSNSVSVGGFPSPLGKKVALDDGLFEVLLVKTPKTPAANAALIGALLAQDLTPKQCYLFRAAELKVSGVPPMAWTLDGESGGAPETAEIRNKKQVVTIIR
jgi:diacylglycerol kinase family enzyme